jgi:hypothetical protein
LAKKSGTSNPTRKEHARSDTDEEHMASMSFPPSTVLRNLRM